MDTPQEIVAEAVTAYRDGRASHQQVELILHSYRAVIDKYVSILQVGQAFSKTGKSYLKDPSVRIFAYAFRQGGDCVKTLAWVSQQCRRFTLDELTAEAVRVLLECMREQGYLQKFPSKLAYSIGQLIGDDPLAQALDEVYTGVCDPPYVDSCELKPCLAETMFDERGILITDRERELLRFLSLSDTQNVSWASRQMGISRVRGKALYDRLKRKARI